MSETETKSKTAYEIAVEFAERFQRNYPRKPIFAMLDDLRKEIENHSDLLTSEFAEALVKHRIACPMIAMAYCRDCNARGDKYDDLIHGPNCIVGKAQEYLKEHGK